jgi:GNAT superfamily N-acetyltransferase
VPNGQRVPREVVPAAHENLRTAFERLASNADGGAVRRVGAVTAAAVGVPVPLFNRAFVFEPPSQEALADAVEWLGAREDPFLVTVPAPVAEDVAPRLRELGLERAGSQPGMALAALEDVAVPDAPATIREVTGREDREAFTTVTTDAFGLPADAAATIDRAAFAAAEVRLFLVRVDGQPAASGVLVVTGDVAGVYSVGVRDPFRRQGVGEAITATLLRAARAAGCSRAVLQSSEMARPLYEGMGFQTVVTYEQYEPAD